MNNLRSPRSCTLLINPQAGEVERFAAEELRNHLQSATGWTIPLLHQAEGEGFEIVLGSLAFTFFPELENRLCEVRHDGFLLHGERNRIAIVGSCPRGTLNGVYELLFQWGCRWVYPEEEPLIPSLTELPQVEGLRVINPELEFRGVCIFPVNQEHAPALRKLIGWMARNRLNFFMTSVRRTKKREDGWEVDWESVRSDLLPELNRRGMILDLSEHSGHFFFPPSLFEAHPEWFALHTDGYRYATGQICYSNPEAIATLTKNYLAYLAERPEVRIIGVWPEDGYGFCQCEACRRPGAVFLAVREIAERIGEMYPEVIVEYLSYTRETSDVPAELLPSRNLAVLVANPRVAAQWKAKSDRVGAQGVYRLHYRISDNTAARACLPFRLEATRDDCREASALGLRGIIPFYIGIDTWWRASLNLHFLSRYSWDTNLESAEILGDFCQHYFPQAQEEAVHLFRLLEKMPSVDQSTPPPWPLWQEWPYLREELIGDRWEAILETFRQLWRVRARLRERGVDTGRTDAIEACIRFSETMFEGWHHRALAVLAFDAGAKEAVRQHLGNALRCEQQLDALLEASRLSHDGVNGARIDFRLFQSWRLQLDRQLLEMRTVKERLPVTDDLVDLEAFLPQMIS